MSKNKQEIFLVKAHSEINAILQSITPMRTRWRWTSSRIWNELKAGKEKSLVQLPHNQTITFMLEGGE